MRAAALMQALGQGRELARHQRIERAAGEAGIGERIPRPVLQLFRLEGLVVERLADHGSVDLIVARERGVIEGGEFCLCRFDLRHAGGAAGLR